MGQSYRKTDCYQKVIICPSEPCRLIFAYCGAISALPEAFFFGWYILSFQRGNPLSQKKGASFGELIITNYDPRPYMTRQLNLFDESLGEWELKLVHIPNHPPRRKESPAGCRASNQNLLQ